MHRYIVIHLFIICFTFALFEQTESKINPITLKQNIKNALNQKHQLIKNQKKKVLTKILNKPLYEFLPPWINFKPIEPDDNDSTVASNANVSNTCNRYKDLAFKLPVKDPDDCHCFYHCASGQVVGHQCCPANLAFNPITLTCDWVPNVFPLCGRNPPDAICLLPKDTGMCRGSIPQYYFDITTRNCKKFKYGGCGGNNNKFTTEKDCKTTCFSFLHEINDTSKQNISSIDLQEQKEPQDNLFRIRVSSKMDINEKESRIAAFPETELKNICPAIEACKIPRVHQYGISTNIGEMCFSFLSGRIGKCNDLNKLDELVDCNMEKLLSCHALGDSGNVLVSTFTKRTQKNLNKKQFLIAIQKNLHENGTKPEYQLKSFGPETMLQHVSEAFFDQLSSPKKFPDENKGNFVENGLRLLIKFARSVVTLVGKSFNDVANALQHFNHEGSIPIGIISSDPSESFEEDTEEDEDTDWENQNGQKIHYYDHQSQIMSNEEAIRFSEDAELLNQINIGLEILANDDHFNADLADAAFIKNEKEVALKNAQSMDNYWVEDFSFSKQRQNEDIQPRTKKPFTKKHEQMEAIYLLFNRIITGSSEFTKRSKRKLKQLVQETFQRFHEEKNSVLSLIPVPEARWKLGSSNHVKMFSLSPSIIETLESLKTKIATEQFDFKHVKKRSFETARDAKSSDDIDRSVSEYLISIVKRIINTKRDMLSSIQASTTNFMKNVLSQGNQRRPSNNTAGENDKDNNEITNSSPCGVNEFLCTSGECITSEYRCDSDVDCKDASDELECDKYECPTNSFICGDGSCIPYRFKCDAEIDCKDGLDEEASTCKDHICDELHDKFQCRNGACVDQRYVCDGDLDCNDGSDEEPCSECHKMMMFDCGEVTTNFTMKCLNTMYICDGIQDCADGSDEHEDRCRLKHEDYNMMMDKMPPKCKLIPRKNLTNLSTVCFDMSVKMIGPCKEGNIGKFPKCSLNDVVGNDEQLQQLLDDNPDFLDLIIKTYFPKDNFGKLNAHGISANNENEDSTKQDDKNAKELEKLEGKEIIIGSSTWPWNRNVRDDELHLPTTCTCLQNQEIYQMTGIKIDFNPCSQPIPWCFVKNEAKCYDQVGYKNFGVNCPDCVLGMEEKEAEDYLSKSPAISWSTAACSKEKIPDIWKKPYFF